MDDPFKHIRAEMEANQTELEKLVENNNAEALLACMIQQLLSVVPDQNIGDQLGAHPAMIEILAEACIPRFGKNSTSPISPLVSNYCYSILDRLVHQRMFDSISISNIPSNISMQSSIVRGSAYPEQTSNKVKNIQGRFDNWFQKKYGISPSRTVDVVDTLVQRAEALFSEQLQANKEEGEKSKERYRTLIKRDNRTSKEQAFVDLFSESEDDEGAAFLFGYVAITNIYAESELPADLASLELSPKLKKSEIIAFKKLFCLNRESMGSTEHIQRKTFYELTSGKVLFSEISNSFDVIWDKFEELAMLDNTFYSSRYQKAKAQWVETQTFEYLCKIFPSSCVYRNLTYPDPTKKNGNTELDLAIHWGPFLVVIEAKSNPVSYTHLRPHETEADLVCRLLLE